MTGPDDRIGVWADSRLCVVGPPKTGSNYVRACLDATLGPSRLLDEHRRPVRAHAPYSEVTRRYHAAHPDGLVVTVRRDPWTWYASAYMHLVRGVTDDPRCIARRALAAWAGAAPEADLPTFARWVVGATNWRRVAALRAVRPDDLWNPPRQRTRPSLYQAHVDAYAPPVVPGEAMHALTFAALPRELANLVQFSHGVELVDAGPRNVGGYDLGELYDAETFVRVGEVDGPALPHWMGAPDSLRDRYTDGGDDV